MNRTHELLKRIVVDPDKMGGRPMVRGWRLSVEQILTWLANGDTRERILAGYPFLEPDDIDACLQYAALVVDRAKLPAVKLEPA